MVIQTAGVAMNSIHYESTIRAASVSYTGWGDVIDDVVNDSITAATTPQAKDSIQTQGSAEGLQKSQSTESFQSTESSQSTEGNVFYDLLAENTNNAGKVSVLESDDYGDELKVQYQTFDNLMMLLFPRNVVESKISPREMFEQLIGHFRDRLYSYLSKSDSAYSSFAELAPTQTWQVNTTLNDFYQESEQTEFYSNGTVVTADGRTIEFDVTAVMSRQFTEYATVNIDYSAANLIDPLVVQLGDGMVDVTDQKFLFDIDADGELDNISILAEMCGYLTLDNNEDGVINDGSELFGTKSGNGFADLAVYDMDNNGWIDENDEIFNRLRVWTKDAEGKDKLVALGVAGIGAIYLGNINTAFSLKDAENNETKGVIRTSGVYLREDGSAGILQQVDMAEG